MASDVDEAKTYRVRVPEEKYLWRLVKVVAFTVSGLDTGD